MLTHLLALGILGPDVEPGIILEVPADRIFTPPVTRLTASSAAGGLVPFGAWSVSVALDPAERLNFAFDAETLLSDGETIDEEGDWFVEVSAEAGALGVRLGTGERAPAISTDNTQILFWLEVDDAFQQNAAFVSGITVPLTVHFTTTSTPTRERERTLAISVRQQ